MRDHVLFAQDSAQTQNRINNMRYALRGFFDGTTKYARYYGVGGGKPSTGLWGKDPGHKLYDVDCAFDDQDHEWYDLAEIRSSWPTSPTTAAAATSYRPTTNASSSTKPSNSRNKPELA